MSINMNVKQPLHARVRPLPSRKVTIPVILLTYVYVVAIAVAVVIVILLSALPSTSSFIFTIKNYSPNAKDHHSSVLLKLYVNNANDNDNRAKTKYRITPQIVEAVKSMADIVEMIESYNLPRFSKTGPHRATALCPFHDDNNPSLSIDGSRRMFQCFSCGAAGDIFQFVREYARVVDGGSKLNNLNGDEMSFPAAVEFVATEFLSPENQAELDLKPLSKTPIDPQVVMKQKELEKRKSRLKLANSVAAEFFCSCLMSLPTAGHTRSHLRERSVSPAAVREYVLGYAPDVYFGLESSSDKNSEDSLVDRLRQLNFTPNEIVEAGLATRKKNFTSKSKHNFKKRPKRLEEVFDETTEKIPESLYGELIDRFRNRLMVPIFDESGKYVIGFGGRLMEYAKDGGESNERFKHAKYINSPETPIFSKKHNLFGISSAKKNLVQSRDNPRVKKIVLVEGYFDALSLHEIGISVAATMGTAITFEQLELAAKAVGRGGQIIVCMDSDNAGLTAVERLCASSLLFKLSDQCSVNVFIASLPPDVKDPSEYIESKGGAASKNITDEFYTDVLSNLVQWSDWFINRTISHYDQTAVANGKHSFAYISNKLSNFLAAFPIPTERTRLAYLSAGKLSELISKQSGTSSTALRIQLESDILDMASRKANTRTELIRRTDSTNDMVRLTSGGITDADMKEQAKRSKVNNSKHPQSNYLRPSRKHFGNDSKSDAALNYGRSSIPGQDKFKEGGKHQKSLNQNNFRATRRRKPKEEHPYMPHFSGFDFFHESDKQWLGLENDFNNRKKKKWHLGEISKLSPKKEPVYFNSNAYLGSADLTLIEKLPVEDAYSTLCNSERNLLRTLVRFAHSRASMSTSLRHSTANLQWTSPERAWLFKCLVEDNDVMHEGEKLKDYFLSRTDVPLNAFGEAVKIEMKHRKDSLFADVEVDGKSQKLETNFGGNGDLSENYDPSDFGNELLDTDQVSLAELEVIYDESYDKNDISRITINPIEIKQDDQIEFHSDGIDVEGRKEQKTQRNECGALDDIFLTTDPDEIELDLLEGKGTRAELMIQEAFACMLRSVAYIRRDQAFEEYRTFSESGSNINDQTKMKRLYDVYKETLDEATELDMAFKRVSSRLIDHTVGGGGFRSAKGEFEDKFFAEMDEWYNNLPDDNENEYSRSNEKMSTNNQYSLNPQGIEANEIEDEIDDEQEFDVDDFLYNFQDN